MYTLVLSELIHKYDSQNVKGQKEQTDPFGLRYGFEPNFAIRPVVDNQQVEGNLERNGM